MTFRQFTAYGRPAEVGEIGSKSAFACNIYPSQFPVPSIKTTICPDTSALTNSAVNAARIAR